MRRCVTHHARARWRERFGREDLVLAAADAVHAGDVWRGGGLFAVLYHADSDAVMLAEVKANGVLLVITVYPYDGERNHYDIVCKVAKLHNRREGVTCPTNP